MKAVALAEIARPGGSGRAGQRTDLPVYSVTKHAGFVPSLEYFKKQVFSRDLADYKVVQAGDFAYATIHLDEGSIGIAPTTALISPMYTVFAVDEDRVDRDYLVRYLKSPRAMAHYPSLGKGAIHRRRAISLAALGRLPVPLPSLEDQRRIVAVFESGDAIRTARRALIAHLDSLERAAFSAMFGGADTEPPRVPLGEVMKWNSGKFLPGKAHTGGPFPVYGGNGVNGTHDEFMYRESRLVVGRVGAHCGAVHLTQPNSWVTDNALIGTLLDPGLTLEYLRPALTVANLNQYAATSGQPSISAARIAHVPIPRPPLSDQQTFAIRAAAIDAERAKVERALALDEELFASLQSRAFSGGL